MEEKVNDGTEVVSECKIKVMLQANYWKLAAGDIPPNWPEKIKLYAIKNSALAYAKMSQQLQHYLKDQMQFQNCYECSKQSTYHLGVCLQ